MSFESGLEARLRANPVILQQTAGRIGWSKRFPALPGISLQKVSDARPQHMKGPQPVRPTGVQIDIWASTPAAAAQLRELVIGSISGSALVDGVQFQRGLISNVRAGPERQQGPATQRIGAEIYNESIDVTLWHNG